MIDMKLVELIEETAKIRGDDPIPREFIEKALEKIETGEIEVERYPMGDPSLSGVYEIASQLYVDTMTKH